MVRRAQAAVSILSALLLLYICLQSSLATSTAATDLSDAHITHDGRQLQQVDRFYGLQQHVSKPHTRRSAINIKKDRKDALPKQPQHPKQQDEQQQQQQQLDVPPVQHREQQHILEEPLEHQQQVQEHPHPHQQHQQEQQQLQVEEVEQPQPQQQEQQQRQEEKEEVDIISKPFHHQLLLREDQDPANSQQQQHMPGQQQQQQQQQQQPALSKSQQLELNPDPELPKPRWVQPGDDSKPSHPDENGNSDGDTHSAGAGGDDDAFEADSTNSAKAHKWLLEPGSGEQHASPDRSSSSSSTVDPTKASNPAVGADGTEHVKAPKWQVQPGVAGEDSSLVADSSPGVAEAEGGSFTPPKWVTDTYADAGATEDSQQQQDPALKLEGAEDAVEEAEDTLEEDEALYPEDYEPGALASKTPRHLRRRKHAKAHLKPHHETLNPSYSVLPGKPAHQQYEALKEYPYKAVEDYLSNQYDLDIIEDNYQHHQKHTAQQKQVNPRQGEAPHQQQQQQQYNMPQVPHEGNLRHTWHEVHDQLQQEQQHQQYSSGYDHADHPPKQHHKSSQDQHQLQRPYQQQKQRAEYEPSPGQQLPPLYADSGSSLDEEDSHAWEERRYELQKRLKLRHEQYKRAQQGRKQQPKQQQPEQQQQQQGPVGGDEEQHQHSRGSYKDEMQQYLEPHHQQQQQQPEQQQEPHHHHQQQQQQQQQQQSKRSWRDELREESEEADYKDDNEPWFKSKTDASFVGGKPGQQQQQQASGDPLKGLLPEDPLESLVPKDPLEQLLQPPGTDTYYRDSDKEETIPDALEDLKNQLISGPTENHQQQQQQKVTTPGLIKGRPTIPPSKQQQQQQQGPSDLTGNFITDKLNKGLLAKGNQHQQQHDPLKELMQVPEQQQQQQQQQTSDSLEDLKDQLLTPDPQKQQQQQQQLPLHKDFTPGDSSGGFWGNGAATGSSRKQQPQAHSITPGDSSGGFWGDGPAKGNKQQQQQKQGHGFGNNSPVPRQQLGPSKNIFSGGSSQLPKWASDTLAPELQPRFDFFGGGSAKPIKGIFGGGSGKPIKAKHSRPLPNDRDTDEHGSEPADDQFTWGPEEQQDWTQERLPERDERKSREETHVHPRDQRDQRPKLVGEDQEEWFQRSVPEPEQAVEDEPETRERIQNAGEQPSVPKWAQPLPTDALLSVDHTDSPRQQQQQLPLPLPLPQQPSFATPVAELEIEAAFPACSDSQQILHCGQLPVETAAEQETHRMCCRMFAPRRIPSELLPPPVERVECERWDLEDDGPLAQPLEWFWEQQQGACTAKATAAVPTFAADRSVQVTDQTVPELSKQQIIQIKSAAMEQRRWIRSRYTKIRELSSSVADSKAVFKHPGGFAGAAELALTQWRLKGSREPQTAALNTLLTGTGVPPKVYYSTVGSGVWSPPTDTPAEYGDPLPMEIVKVGYGGFNKAPTCPANFPVGAPSNICSHIAFVEMDGQMSYKQAMAALTTRDASYAQTVLAIADAWARKNKQWGLRSENGPLEAAWGIAAMARSLEMLKGTEMSEDLLQQWRYVKTGFTTWFTTVVLPELDHYVEVITKRAVDKGIPTVHGNWHSSIAEAWMAVGVLTDDQGLYNKGVQLFGATVSSYFRWGRQAAWREGRLLGECSETLRDIYHTQFGLGGLLQAAEMAWQQNMDLYKTEGYALASAMELHARIINAWDSHRNESLLPEGYRFYDTSMPPAPSGTDWVFEIQKQKWFARERKTKLIVSELEDGYKYLLGVKYMPTGWELGHNHYVGRLGMKLPETTKLLRRYKVDWHEFHWGLGTLSHANSASLLWRPGVTEDVLCDKDPTFRSIGSNITVAV